MPNIGPIVLVVIAAGVAGTLFWQRRRPGAPEAGEQPPVSGEAPPAAVEKPARAASRPLGPGPAGLAADLSRWVAAGLISAEQAESIAGHERAATAWRGPAAKERRVSLLAEALGYVGVVLVLAGAGVWLGYSWEDLAAWGRLAIPAAATALLVLGGVLLRRQEEPAFRRLMSVLWALSVASTAWGLGVLGADLLEISEEHTALLAAAGCAALAAGLYLVHRHGLQQLVLLVSIHGLVITGLLSLPMDDPATWRTEELPVWCFSVAVWALGLAWAALGWRNVIRPGWLAIGFGCLGAVIGPSVGVGEYEWLLAPGLLTAAALMAVSVPARQTPLLALGTLGAFGYITWAVVHYFSDSLGVPVALVIVGAVFLALAVLAGTLASRSRKKAPAVAE